MAKITKDFCVLPSTAKEVTTALQPIDAARELACQKALYVMKHLDNDIRCNAVVIGCDTVVDVDGKVFGKPKDKNEAGRMLRLLSGRSHKVHTGYCVASVNGIALGTETTVVTFRQLADSEIENYVDSGMPFDKAGAYGIQETDFVVSVQGSYDNVVGFPTEALADELKKFKSTDWYKRGIYNGKL